MRLLLGAGNACCREPRLGAGTRSVSIIGLRPLALSFAILRSNAWLSAGVNLTLLLPNSCARRIRAIARSTSSASLSRIANCISPLLSRPSSKSSSSSESDGSETLTSSLYRISTPSSESESNSSKRLADSHSLCCLSQSLLLLLLLPLRLRPHDGLPHGGIPYGARGRPPRPPPRKKLDQLACP